jgi:dolichol kinase/membrane-associated phospholipid phosphatase
MKKRLLLIGAIVILAFLLDKQAALLAEKIRVPILVLIARIVSDLTLVIAVVIPLIIVAKNKDKKIPALYLSIACAFIITYVLKFLFKIERPDGIRKTIFMTMLPDYSFPSSHSAVAFAPLYFIHGKVLQFGYFTFGVLVLISRIYLGMHTLFDVVFGACIGYLIGIYFFENSRLELKKDALEVRRQAFHFALGIVACILYYKGILGDYIFVYATIVLIIIFFTNLYKIPGFYHLFYVFERESDLKEFPGKGPIFFMLGCMISSLIFPKDIALASIIILGVGDSVSHVIGKYFGKTKHPLSQKLLEGSLIGAATAFLFALLFVNTWEAFLAAFIAMSVEAIDIKVGNNLIDDNLLIPITAGLVITLLRTII